MSTESPRAGVRPTKEAERGWYGNTIAHRRGEGGLLSTFLGAVIFENQSVADSPPPHAPLRGHFPSVPGLEPHFEPHNPPPLYWPSPPGRGGSWAQNQSVTLEEKKTVSHPDLAIVWVGHHRPERRHRRMQQPSLGGAGTGYWDLHGVFIQ